MHILQNPRATSDHTAWLQLVRMGRCGTIAVACADAAVAWLGLGVGGKLALTAARRVVMVTAPGGRCGV